MKDGLTLVKELKDKIHEQQFEIKGLKELCNKYEEEHKTTFEEWKKTINIINELEKDMSRDDLSYVETQYVLDKIKELKGEDKE